MHLLVRQMPAQVSPDIVPGIFFEPQCHNLLPWKSLRQGVYRSPDILVRESVADHQNVRALGWGSALWIAIILQVQGVIRGQLFHPWTEAETAVKLLLDKVAGVQHRIRKIEHRSP